MDAPLLHDKCYLRLCVIYTFTCTYVALGKPGVLQSLGLQRVGHHLATEQGQRGVSSVSPPVCDSGLLTQLSDPQASPLSVLLCSQPLLGGLPSPPGILTTPQLALLPGQPSEISTSSR